MINKHFTKGIYLKPILKVNEGLDVLRWGYENMADINLKMAEMGLDSDVGCLECYECQLEEEAKFDC